MAKKVSKDTGWVSVKERLPEEEICVLVTDGEHIEIASYIIISSYGKTEWTINSFFDDITGVEITHWMPLPELPK